MNSTFIVVADASRSRFFTIEADLVHRERPRLVERVGIFNPNVEVARKGGAGRVTTERVSNRRAGVVHPIEARGEHHRLELERWFGREIARLTSQMANAENAGAVVLIADSRLLGLIREDMRASLKPAIKLKELAKDYVWLTPAELHDQLALNNLLQAHDGVPA